MIDWTKCTPLSDEDLDTTVTLAVEGNKQAIDKLVMSNVKLAASIAHSYKSFDGSNVEDLTSEAVLGLVESIPLYDADRGTKFSTFASWRMRMRVLNRVLDDFRLVKIGTTQAQRKLFWRLNRETAKLRKEGLDPTSQAIADRLQVRVDEVESMKVRMSRAEASLDAPTNATVSGSDHIGTMHECFDSGIPSPEYYTTKSRMTAWVQTQMVAFEQRLSDKEMVVWNHRIADNKYTMDQVAKLIGHTRQRVDQIEKKLHAAFIRFAKKQAR